MIEAFEVGIALALQDGVEEGIAKAQRDIAAVTRAVGVGATSVQRLQEAGVAALTVAHSAGAQVGSAPGGTSARQAAATAADREEKLPPADASAVPPILFQETQAGASVAAAVTLPSSVLGSIVVAGPGGASRGSGFGAAEAAKPQALTSTPATARIAPSFGVSGFESQPEPKVAAPGANWQRMAQAAPAQSAERFEKSQPGVRLDFFAATGSGSHPAGDPPFAVANGDRFAGSLQKTPTMFEDVARPRAPNFERGPSRQPLRDDQSATAADDPAEAGPSRGSAETPQGPTQGDVFLDGALVGRWMSRLLSKAASRATSGPTGFDARRSALLPGPTVGG
jgi:hypothetical protein